MIRLMACQAIIYKKGGLVEAAPGNDNVRAARIIKLVGLGKMPSVHDQENEASDRRWNNRREAWDIATESRRVGSSTDVRSNCVADKRFWSIWMTVFKDDPDMLKRILDRIPGTAKHCFDAANGSQAIARILP